MATFRLPYDIGYKLGIKSEHYGFIIQDLEAFQKWVLDLSKSFPKVGGMLPSIDYLHTMAIHVLLVSLLEYSLKCVGKKVKQRDLPDYIRKSNVLDDREKEWLIYLVLSRHNVVHSSGHYDDDLRRRVKQDLKRLKVEIPKEDFQLSPLSPEEYCRCIRLLWKFIFLDVFSSELTKEDRETIKASLGS